MLRYVVFLLVICSAHVKAQIKTGWYRAVIQRADSVEIVFNAEAVLEKGKTVFYIRNDRERLKVDQVEVKKDSVLMEMPFFESSFRLVRTDTHTLSGLWIKGTSRQQSLVLPVRFVYGRKDRFVITNPATEKLQGKWQVTFTRPNGTKRPAVALFQQKGNYVAGSFITPSGDYRFLEGVLNGNRLQLSCFDGSHAYYFAATVNGNRVVNGQFYSSASERETFTASRNANATLPDTSERTQMKEGETRLRFRFKDVNGNMVSLTDTAFRNKVIVLQLMGSWCPNCMDESRFLGDFYAAYKDKGVEIIALAYELTMDEERSRASIQKFIDRFNIRYPVLIAPVTASDNNKTEKTLPQLTAIRSFPTTVFIGKDGTVAKVHTGFYGPGTGAYYEAFKKEFYETITRLLQQ